MKFIQMRQQTVQRCFTNWCGGGTKRKEVLALHRAVGNRTFIVGLLVRDSIYNSSRRS